MTDRLDVVTIRVEHKSPKVVRMVMRTQPGGAIVTSAGGERRLVESLDAGAARYPERDMDGRDVGRAAADPEFRFGWHAESGERAV